MLPQTSKSFVFGASDATCDFMSTFSERCRFDAEKFFFHLWEVRGRFISSSNWAGSFVRSLKVRAPRVPYLALALRVEEGIALLLVRWSFLAVRLNTWELYCHGQSRVAEWFEQVISRCRTSHFLSTPAHNRHIASCEICLFAQEHAWACPNHPLSPWLVGRPHASFPIACSYL